MTSRFEKERAKQIQDKCQDLLTQMLRDEDNKYCVDCDAKGPRWASWNLGIFLCIRCAGIHRNLGVHISKVKSVNLDTWTPEQVVSLQQMGNSRARAVYEANLPDTFRRPQTDCSLESFIRAKYEHKKYIAREWVPPTLPKVNWDKELDDEAEKQRRRKKEGSKSGTTQNALPPVKKPEVVPQLPKPRSSVSPKASRASNNGGATLDLLGLDGPTNQTSTNGSGSGDDIFSSFLSAVPTASPSPTSASNNGTTETATTTASKADEESFFNQPAPSTQEKSKMTKDSILALYGTPSQQSVFGVPSGIYNQQALPQYTQPIQNVGSFGQIVPGQMQMTGSQMNVNGIGLGNSLGGNMQMGAINSGIAMQTQMMIQMGQAAVPSSNGWSGMLAQNIQPAPGSNPFFNLGTQAPVSNAFVTQLPQQMSQMSLGGLGKPPPAALPGQTLSSNLWQ
ncbi:stromal membrane-associated protein 1 isoform X4 [Diachasma alloeum]|uniref:stromal membrane-associated protein 1 isoform X4 n=1 Tax=Diachasma alloeum TaxID=454923 RepID=UPI0007383B98|nr:stromal membrane-associated protein 1 isoform X4 [Diachasma alloeum]